MRRFIPIYYTQLITKASKLLFVWCIANNVIKLFYLFISRRHINLIALQVNYEMLGML